MVERVHERHHRKPTPQNRTPQGVPACNRWLSNATPPDCRPPSALCCSAQAWPNAAPRPRITRSTPRSRQTHQPPCVKAIPINSATAVGSGARSVKNYQHVCRFLFAVDKPFITKGLPDMTHRVSVTSALLRVAWCRQEGIALLMNIDPHSSSSFHTSSIDLVLVSNIVNSCLVIG